MGKDDEDGKTRGNDSHYQPKVEIQEKGEILFFYRPKVERNEAHSSDDVQRLYIVLRPELSPSGEEINQELGHKSSTTDHSDDVGAGVGVPSKKRKIGDSKEAEAGAETRKSNTTEAVNIEEQMLIRLIVIGRKSLPNIPHVGSDQNKSRKRRPYWGFVDIVTTNISDLKDALKAEEHDTKTRGHRHTPPARALGEGIYHILKHTNPQGKNKKMHTHLIYKLRFPTPQHHEEEESSSSPQSSLHIEREASYLIQIKNPSASGGGSGFRGLQSKRKAELPAHLLDKFGKLRYCPADPTDFLNYEGCEFLLIAASDDVSQELGLDLETEEYQVSDEESEPAEAVASASCSDLLKTFGTSDGGGLSSSIAPLLKGTWD